MHRFTFYAQVVDDENVGRSVCNLETSIKEIFELAVLVKAALVICLLRSECNLMPDRME